MKEILVQKGTKQPSCRQHICLTDEKKGNWISEDPHQRKHNHEEHDSQTIRNEQKSRSHDD